MDERQKLRAMIRQLRKRISPDVLERARHAANQEIGYKPPEPENEASRLFKMALENRGARRTEVLRFLERKFRHKLN